MNIRDPIHGSIPLDELESAVVRSPYMQRLRSIKQMGFSDIAFPGATHSRFLHSIGAMHLAGIAFDSIFQHYAFERADQKSILRQVVRLAALLHDIGHAPLSHCTEFAMPSVQALRLPLHRDRADPINRRATHEDYTLKIISDSSLSEVIRARAKAFTPAHVAALIDAEVPLDDDLFRDRGQCFRNVLSQIVSSELDVDRMDYLRRDSYFAGVGYGGYDQQWIFHHLTFYVDDDNQANLALDPRAIYAFNDFLIARYHMFLMVYFHHKSVIYEEMLRRFFQSKDAGYKIPSDIEAYLDVDDYQLYSILKKRAREGHAWADRIVSGRPYQLLIERHGKAEDIDLRPISDRLGSAGIDFIETSSRGDLSRYTQPGNKRRRGTSIYVYEKPDNERIRNRKAMLLEESSHLFAAYESQRRIRRIYVPDERLGDARRALDL